MIDAEKLENSIKNVLKKVNEILDSEETALAGDIVQVILYKFRIHILRQSYFI